MIFFEIVFFDYWVDEFFVYYGDVCVLGGNVGVGLGVEVF